jgi:hypothetical protein
VQAYQVDLDWATVYGPEWEVLSGACPCSTLLAVGSAVAVYPKGRLMLRPAEGEQQPTLALRPSGG